MPGSVGGRSAGLVHHSNVVPRVECACHGSKGYGLGNDFPDASVRLGVSMIGVRLAEHRLPAKAEPVKGYETLSEAELL